MGVSVFTRFVAATLVATSGILVSAAGGASGSPGAGAQLLFDYRGTELWNVDQTIRVLDPAPHQYWSSGGWFTTGGGYYMGLQTNGYVGDAVLPRTVVFSVWNATAAEGANCQTFGGEGIGYSCRLPYDWGVGRTYRMRVWRLHADAGGVWWGAWILHLQSGNETWIGNIRAPADNLTVSGTYSFTESFGNVACDDVERSAARFGRPTGNAGTIVGALGERRFDSCSHGALSFTRKGNYLLYQGSR